MTESETMTNKSDGDHQSELVLSSQTNDIDEKVYMMRNTTNRFH